MKINFRARYLDFHNIVTNIVESNNNLSIHIFYFFENNQLLYTKKMVCGYNKHNYYRMSNLVCNNYDRYNYYRISNSVLNSFYEKQYKISYMHYAVLLTDTYVNENQRLIYMNVYEDSSFDKFIIGTYYKFLSRDYIHYGDDKINYYCPPRWIGNFTYYNHYITNQEINNVCDQLEIYGNSIKLLHSL